MDTAGMGNGFRMKRAAVFFDRDNTLIASDGYLGNPGRVVLVDGAAEAVTKARQYGFKTITFSNQSGVARGLFTEDDVRAVNARMDELLRQASGHAIIEHHEFCPYHPEATVERYRQDSELRKPKPGMLLKAAAELSLDLGRSWVVGDAPRDIAAGKAAGCRTILFTDPKLPPSPAASAETPVQPDFTAASLKEAIEIIAREAFRTASGPGAAPEPVEDAPPPPPEEPTMPEPSQTEPPQSLDEPPVKVPVEPVETTSHRLDAEKASESLDFPATPGVVGTSRTDALLAQVLEELKRNREDIATEFSVSKLLAGIVQVVAVAVLFVAYLNRDMAGKVDTYLLFAIMLQALAIALLIMGRQR